MSLKTARLRHYNIGDMKCDAAIDNSRQRVLLLVKRLWREEETSRYGCCQAVGRLRE